MCISSLFHVLFSLFGCLFYFFRFYCCTHGDRKYYYVKVVESIQFVCSGISGSCRDVSAVNVRHNIVSVKLCPVVLYL